jgi:arginyl-tRNA synthetase
LAGLLHTFYNKHRILPPAAGRDLLAVVPEGLGSDEGLQKERLAPERTAARLALMQGIQQVLKNGLGVLGVSAPEQM